MSRQTEREGSAMLFFAGKPDTSAEGFEQAFDQVQAQAGTRRFALNDVLSPKKFTEYLVLGIFRYAPAAVSDIDYYVGLARADS